MLETNKFRVVGVVYSDPKYFKKRNGDLVCSVVLAINDKKKIKYIPIKAYKDNADILLRLGRNGNLVAISGYIDTTEFFDKTTGSSQVSVSFIMEDMMMIEKMTPTRLNEKRIDDLIRTFNLE